MKNNDMLIKLPKETARAVVLMRQLTDLDWSCGTLHIAVCDGNMDDEHIEFCAEEFAKSENGTADNSRYETRTPEQIEIERELLELLVCLQDSSRHMAYWIKKNMWCVTASQSPAPVDADVQAALDAVEMFETMLSDAGVPYHIAMSSGKITVMEHEEKMFELHELRRKLDTIKRALTATKREGVKQRNDSQGVNEDALKNAIDWIERKTAQFRKERKFFEPYDDIAILQTIYSTLHRAIKSAQLSCSTGTHDKVEDGTHATALEIIQHYYDKTAQIPLGIRGRARAWLTRNGGIVTNTPAHKERELQLKKKD